jgi:hypothetical protein
MMHTFYMSNYYLCDFLQKFYIIKIEENDGTYNDVYILHVKRYAIKIYSKLER